MQSWCYMYYHMNIYILLCVLAAHSVTQCSICQRERQTNRQGQRQSERNRERERERASTHFSVCSRCNFVIIAWPVLPDKSLMAEQASQWHEIYRHDLEVMSSNPSQVELRVCCASVLSRTWIQNTWVKTVRCSLSIKNRHVCIDEKMFLYWYDMD